MAVVNIDIEIKDGMATVVGVSAPAGVAVSIRLRDYDTGSSVAGDLDADENGRPCIEVVTEYPEQRESLGFV